MSVSLCMIVRNEADNLRACLQSAVDLVDELVVVDTGSSDSTAAIAKEFGAKVHGFPWCDDFSAARNESLRHATSDWIFWLDADDRVEDDSREKLRDLFATLPRSMDGFLMRCRCLGTAGAVGHEVDHVRVFRNDPRIRYRYRVHEQVAPTILRAGGRLRGTEIVIRHEGYRDLETYRRKQERNLRILELECEQRPLDPFMLYYRGVALLDLERSAEALISLQLCESLVPRGTAVARMLPGHLAEAYSREGMDEDAIATFATAQRRYPADASIALGGAMHSYRLGRIAKADSSLSAFLNAHDAQPDLASPATDPSAGAFRARHYLAVMRFLLGRLDSCEELERQVVEDCPTFGEAWLLLGDSLLRQGKVPDFERLVGRLERLSGTDVARILLLVAQRLDGGDTQAAARLIRDASLMNPEHPFLHRARSRLPSAERHSWMSAAYFLSTQDLPLARLATV